MTDVESVSPPFSLTGTPLFCAFYINELMMRMLPEGEPHQELFPLYTHLLKDLSATSCFELASLEPLLRSFELSLVEALGYDLDLGRDCETGQTVQSELDYRFLIDRGVRYYRPAGMHQEHPVKAWQQQIYSGHILLAISARDFSSHEVRLATKYLMRYWLGHYLGGKPLKSRSLFSSRKQTG